MNAWDSINPIKRSSLADEIVQKIQELIQKEPLKSGSRLPAEAGLAEKFGVGRSTIREALQALVALGVIERSKRGTFVSNRSGGGETEWKAPQAPSAVLKDCQLADLLEWRRLLEKEICVLATERATDEDVEQIGAALQKMEKSAEENRVGDFIRADADFHISVAEAAHNQVLDRMLTLVQDVMLEEIGEALNRDPHLLNRALESHRLIYQAIRGEDACLAKSLITKHLDDVTGAIERKPKEGQPACPASVISSANMEGME